MEKTADEVKRLQSCINDLISVLALAAIWSGNESGQMVGTLLDALLGILRLDFACVRLNDSIDGSPTEVVRLTQRQHPSAQPQEVGRALDRWLSGDQTTSRFLIPNPAGEGAVAIASLSLGLQDKVGVLVAGSRRADFPTDIELLLLRVAANQAAIGLQEARRSGDQKRVAEALERRVAERTSQLTDVNEELRHIQAYLAEAQRLSHTGSFGWRLSTGEILWSEETFRIFQYDRTTKPSVELVLQRVHPEDAAFVKQTIERASQDGKDFDFEHRLLMPDGSVKHVHVVAHAERDESGEVEFVGAVMDVTEQHRSRAALEKAFDEIKNSQDRLRLVIDTIPGMVWSAQPDGTVDFVNRRWVEYHGLSSEELGRQGGFASVIHPDDVVWSIDNWNAALAAGTSTEGEIRVRGADGEYRWFLARAVPLHDDLGNIVQWYGTITDIEDRKRAEMLLGGEKRLLEMIAKGEPLDIILHALCQLVEELASGALSSILLLDPKTNQLRHGAAPSLPTKYVEAIDGALIGPSAGSCGTAAYLAEPVIVSDVATDSLWADYRELALGHGLRACWSTPIVSSERKVLGAFAIYYREPRSPTPQEDGLIARITHLASIAVERKRGEEALHQAQADLAHVSRVTMMGELTASLAHEVNQPITAAVTNANTCMRWLAGDAPNIQEAREAAIRSAKDGTRAAEIISRIRLLFKKGTLEREPVDINEVIREIIILLRSETTRYSISVRTELGSALPELIGDHVQLQQVFMNLALNGIEAMKDVDDKRELFIKSERWKNEQVLVSVRDTGIGLPPQQADQIFDAFFTTKLHGTGMGLSISRSIVESHGGRLWADSNSPRGATFHIALPTRVEAH